MSDSQLVWLITGTSTGLGRAWVAAVLERGDKVIATARGRSFASLNDLKAKGADILELDVTSPLDKLKGIAAEAVKIHGRIDVLVNNAGYLLNGVLEESTQEETMDQFNTNVFGGLNVARAFLPYMRERKSGTVIWVGSLGAFLNTPGAALYCASKAAVRSISEAVHGEISAISPNLRSTCIDFGYFRTDLLASGHRPSYTPRIDDYDPVSKPLEEMLTAASHNQPGDPQKGVNAVIDLVRGEGKAKGKPWPSRGLILGTDAFQVVSGLNKAIDTDLQTWQEVITSTDIVQ